MKTKRRFRLISSDLRLRTHNSLCHSYESASLRRYDRGRADNIRSNSASTRRLIEALTSRNYPERVTDTRKLLYEACDVQQKQIDSVSIPVFSHKSQGFFKCTSCHWFFQSNSELFFEF